MRALLGSMMDLMSRNGQVIELKEEIQSLSNSVKEVEKELSETKYKFFKIEYDVKEIERKEEFSTKDSIVIRNLEVPSDGDDQKAVKEALAHLNVEDFRPEDDILKVVRRGHKNGKLGSIFVKLSNEDLKVKVMKVKKELKKHKDPKIKDLKIMNFKTQEQILLENALRNLLSVTPNGDRYEFNGNMRLISLRSRTSKSVSQRHPNKISRAVNVRIRDIHDQARQGRQVIVSCRLGMCFCYSLNISL